ncbi:MAG TPA: hypothetical protein VNA12_09435 [Mycobacteriales bacterium]|nr:hypothetical protein [Mycobacteriales bacterium]
MIEPPPPRPQGSRALTIASVVTLVAVLVVGFAVLRTIGQRAQRLALSTDLAAGRIEGEPGATYSYAWVNNDGSPVRWNPCRPIHWVVNSAGAPAGAIGDLTDAIARISEVTGIAFVHDGEVDEPTASDRSPAQPRRYGDGWAPLLISWARLDSPLGMALSADPDTVGVASPIAVSSPGEPGVIVSGQIVLESAVVTSPGFLTTRSQGAVILHELSHVLGLGHTTDNAQLLYEGGEPIAGTGELGPGDRAGLVSVGRSAGCLETPKPDDLD